MRIFLIFALVPLALGVPQERAFSLANLLNLDGLRETFASLFDTLGADPTEQLCESTCHNLAVAPLLHSFCPAICHSFQALAVHFGHTQPAVGKRSLLDSLINVAGLKETVASLFDLLGTDPTEQLCETKCHEMVVGGETALLHTFCPAICHSFQALAVHFGHTQPAVGKRSFLDTLINLGGLRETFASLFDTLGADPTEQACERACHSMVAGGETALLHTFCTPICHSFQALASHFGHTQPASAPPAVEKRLFVEGLFDVHAIKETVATLFDTLGADPTEAVCESTCHGLVLGGETALIHTYCKPICASFQYLAQHFGHTQHASVAPTSA